MKTKKYFLELSFGYESVHKKLLENAFARSYASQEASHIPSFSFESFSISRTHFALFIFIMHIKPKIPNDELFDFFF